MEILVLLNLTWFFQFLIEMILAIMERSFSGNFGGGNGQKTINQNVRLPVCLYRTRKMRKFRHQFLHGTQTTETDFISPKAQLCAQIVAKWANGVEICLEMENDLSLGNLWRTTFKVLKINYFIGDSDRRTGKSLKFDLFSMILDFFVNRIKIHWIKGQNGIVKGSFYSLYLAITSGRL